MLVGCKECVLPTVTTSETSAVTQTTAISGGEVTDDGGSAVTERGVCWNTTAAPTTADSKTKDGSGLGPFSSSLTSLIADTKYFVRAYATNSEGTAYGNEISFTTLSLSGIIFNPNLTYGSLTDVEGNVYKTIQIGTQVWMAENLRTTKYKDGVTIPLVTDFTAWTKLTTPAYCWYNNDPVNNKNTYGALYNWYTVNTGKLCPTGWHVPSDAEWTVLSSYLGGGETIAGGKMKEIGTKHWLDPNNGATNESGFSAIAAGSRSYNNFSSQKFSAIWWAKEELLSSNYMGFIQFITHSETRSTRSAQEKYYGNTVRCLKD